MTNQTRFGVSFDTKHHIAHYPNPDSGKEYFYPFKLYMDMANDKLTEFVNRYSPEELESIELDFVPYQFSIRELKALDYNEVLKQAHLVLNQINQKASELPRREP